MRKVLLFIALLFIVTGSYAQQRLLDRAKVLIRTELKQTLNDYSSYQPVSYGQVDSLFTDIWDDDTFLNLVQKLADAKEALPNKVDDWFFDVSPIIDYLDEQLKTETNPNVKLKILDMKGKYIDFKTCQGYVLDAMKSFTPTFIGWKLVHKYRTKNEYNAVILLDHEFHFDIGMTRVTKIKPHKED